MKTFLLVVILLAVFAGIIWFSGKRKEEVSFPQPTLTPTVPVVCTREVKLCPDGSTVGRTGPNCEFAPCPTPTSISTPTPKATISPKITTINMTDSGFVPSNITINIGETVKFVNQSNLARWPASGIHPTHDLYPEKGGCISSAFDACHGLAKGEIFSFTFTFKGTWPYHDHLAPSLKGTIIVQ
ncbi:MAG: hypothetical protein AAB627_00435 [Patescibacteria group bacterium]